MAEKAAPGMEFSSWTSLPEGPLGELLSNAKSMAIGYGIQESGLKDWLNKSFGNKSQSLPSDYAPSAGVMPPADYGLQAPAQQGIRPPAEYALPPSPAMAAPFKPVGLPNAMNTTNPFTQQPATDDHVLAAWGWNTK